MMDEMRDAKQGLDMKSCGRLSVPIRHDICLHTTTANWIFVCHYMLLTC